MIRWNVSPSVPDLSLPNVNLDAAVNPRGLPSECHGSPLSPRPERRRRCRRGKQGGAHRAEAEIGLSGGVDVAPKA